MGCLDSKIDDKTFSEVIYTQSLQRGKSGLKLGLNCSDLLRDELS